MHNLRVLVELVGTHNCSAEKRPHKRNACEVLQRAFLGRHYVLEGHELGGKEKGKRCPPGCAPFEHSFLVSPGRLVPDGGSEGLLISLVLQLVFWV